MHDHQLRELRWETNPYDGSKDATDRRFHSLVQQDYYETVISVLDMTIDWDAIRGMDCSGIVEQACKERCFPPYHYP